MKKLGSICCILLSGFVLNIVFIGCGGKATGADGTVIAEFEWDGKHHITLEEMMAEIDELPDYKKTAVQREAGARRIYDPHGRESVDTLPRKRSKSR